jgi:hypothetical protein
MKKGTKCVLMTVTRRMNPEILKLPARVVKCI